MNYYVYILASQKNGTIYIVIKSNLLKRIYQHKENLIEGFTQTYAVCRLVYYEKTSNVKEALIREKQLKKWNPQWKINLIEKENPDWIDLYDLII